MTFLHPEFIYWLMPLLIVLFYLLLTQADQLHRHFSPEVAERLRVDSNRMSLRTRNILFFFMLFFMVLALAFPVIEEGKVRVQTKPVEIMVALDISDSMRTADVYPSRLEMAKQKLLSLLEHLSSQRIGVMVFAKASYLVVPPTSDHQVIRQLVEQLELASITENATDIMGLLEATASMMKETSRQELLILSDGGEQRDLSREIDLAKRKGIRIDVLLIGTQQGAPIPDGDGGLLREGSQVVISRVNDAISELATKSGGVLIASVLDERDVVRMLEEIIGKMPGSHTDEKEVTQFIPLFFVPLGLAMLLLIIATSSMSDRERLKMPGAFLLGWMLSYGVPSDAGLLDFKLLDEARRSYEDAEYAKSARLFEQYAKARRSDEAMYDQANALYRKGEYVKAAKLYERVAFFQPEHRFDVLHNLGNAYARQGGLDAYRKAVKAYEKALQLKESKATRENMEQIRALVIAASAQAKRPHGQNALQASSKGSTSLPEERASAMDGFMPAVADSMAESPAARPAIREDHPPALREDGATVTENSGDEDDRASTARGHGEVKAMSDKEEQRWLKLLQIQPKTHLYKIQTVQTSEEHSDAKPW